MHIVHIKKQDARPVICSFTLIKCLFSTVLFVFGMNSYEFSNTVQSGFLCSAGMSCKEQFFQHIMSSCYISELDGWSVDLLPS